MDFYLLHQRNIYSLFQMSNSPLFSLINKIYILLLTSYSLLIRFCCIVAPWSHNSYFGRTLFGTCCFLVAQRWKLYCNAGCVPLYEFSSLQKLSMLSWRFTLSKENGHTWFFFFLDSMFDGAWFSLRGSYFCANSCCIFLIDRKSHGWFTDIWPLAMSVRSGLCVQIIDLGLLSCMMLYEIFFLGLA